jgi:uncharacterized membrane protein
VVVAIGVILPALVALIVYRFSLNYFVLSNYIFTAGLFVAATGGVAAVIPFFFIKV